MPWFWSEFLFLVCDVGGNDEFSGNGNFGGDDDCASNYCMHCPAGEKAELKKIKFCLLRRRRCCWA